MNECFTPLCAPLLHPSVCPLASPVCVTPVASPVCVPLHAGGKLWYFMSNLDHDFVDAQNRTVPPPLSVNRAYGSTVTCGRMTRVFVSNRNLCHQGSSIVSVINWVAALLFVIA